MSTGTSCSSNCRIFSTVKPPETTIFTCWNPSPSSARRTFKPTGVNPQLVWNELRIDARRLEGAHLRNHRLVDERLRRVDPHAVEPLAQRARHLERRPDTVVLEVDEGDEAHVPVHELGELLRREHGVAAVGGDECVGHRADTDRKSTR